MVDKSKFAGKRRSGSGIQTDDAGKSIVRESKYRKEVYTTGEKPKDMWPAARRLSQNLKSVGGESNLQIRSESNSTVVEAKPKETKVLD